MYLYRMICNIIQGKPSIGKTDKTTHRIEEISEDYYDWIAASDFDGYSEKVLDELTFGLIGNKLEKYKTQRCPTDLHNEVDDSPDDMLPTPFAMHYILFFV